MRVYIIGKDDIRVSATRPDAVGRGERVIASLKEWRAARLTGNRLLALWNGLPDAETLAEVADRDALLAQLWSMMESLPDPEPERRRSKQAEVITLLRRPEGATVDEVMALTGWQRHTVRGLFSGALKKKLGLIIGSESEERGRVYRIAEAAA